MVNGDNIFSHGGMSRVAMAGLEIALDNLAVGLICIDNNYVVQWESTKVIDFMSENRGYTVDEVCYKSVFNRDTPCEKCALKEMIESGALVKHLHKENGHTIEITASPLLRHDGQVQGGVLKIEDITVRIAQENKIKQLNHVMNTILNNIPVYLFVKDPADDFRYLYWNKAMAENTKIPVSKVLGNTDFEVFPSEQDALRFRRDDISLLEGGHTIEFQEEYVNAHGEHRTVNTIKALIPSENKVPWLLGLSWDITELKNTEKELIIAKENAEQSNLLKSAFLANMSHEIRTPLNAIVGFSDLLVEEEDKHERAEYMNIIQKNNELLLQLISDILDISKIEAQSLEFVSERVGVNLLCRAIVAAANLKEDAMVPILFDQKCDELYIETDYNRVSQVLSNMVNNAIKFTSTGSINVGWNAINDREIEFYVQDTGKGIDAQQLDSVFDRFVKLDPFVQGTGLGLSICKSIIERLQGRIGVDSQLGVGSRFWFTLPFNEQPGDVPAVSCDKGAVSAKESIHKITDGMVTILIAEDIDSNYILLYSILHNNYNLVRAHNGAEAVELSRLHNPSIILMDIKMPEMDGLEATKKIREYDTDVPIIALTAFAFDTDRQKALQAGCNDFLSKPISVSLLKELLVKYLK